MFETEQSSAGTASDSTADGETERGSATTAQYAATQTADATDDAIKKELRTRANKLQEERDALLKEKEARETAEQKRKEREAAEAGKFEELAATRERERDEAKSEAISLKAENDQLREAMKAGIETGWKALPDSVRKLGEKQHPEDDPRGILGRWQFLHDPDTIALVAELTVKGEAIRGNGRDPKLSGTAKANDADALAANASRYRF
jgi:hypothetical protein